MTLGCVSRTVCPNRKLVQGSGFLINHLHRRLHHSRAPEIRDASMVVPRTTITQCVDSVHHKHPHISVGHGTCRIRVLWGLQLGNRHRICAEKCVLGECPSITREVRSNSNITGLRFSKTLISLTGYRIRGYLSSLGSGVSLSWRSRTRGISPP